VYEQVAGTSPRGWPHGADPYLKQNYDFDCSRTFDHLYRYANLLDLTKGKKA
jgi:hypothetical protein